MFAFPLGAVLFVSLAAASPEHAASPVAANQASEAELVEALRASSVAEIYVIQRGTEFPMTPMPDTVRDSGCRYVLFPNSPAWLDLERSLAAADVRFTPTETRVVARIGLVLSDERGTLLEIYSGDEPWANGRITAVMQRRLMEVSSSFVRALLGVAGRHPEAISSTSRPELCPPRNP